jgi:hypothetical protein
MLCVLRPQSQLRNKSHKGYTNGNIIEKKLKLNNERLQSC